MKASASDDQLSVLVIDDEPEMVQLVTTALRRAGHQVVGAASAEEGLAALPLHTFHVAFLDHHLPGMEGLVLGDFLHRNNPDMEIALITAETDPRLRRETVRAGLTFIQKPFDLRELSRAVDRYRERAAERLERRAREGEADLGPQLGRYLGDLRAFFSIPGVPARIADSLRQRIRELLHDLSTATRYNERERALALAGLLAAEVLGVSLPRAKDGASAFEQYDRVMRENGRRTEFSQGS